MAIHDNIDVGAKYKLTLGQAVALSGIPSHRLRHLADSGVLPYSLTGGGHRRFALADIEAIDDRPIKHSPTPDIETLLSDILAEVRALRQQCERDKGDSV